MSVSLYQVSVPLFVKVLRNLRSVLGKGAEHAAAHKIDESVLLGARLFPDMRPLSFQVQVATDMARGGASRLAGSEPPKFDDNETTFAQLIDRIDRTLAFIESVDRKAIDEGEGRTITRPVRGEPHAFTAMNYLQQFILPNLFFHATTAYALLRHNGVPLAKGDFLGKLD
jgi:hypothetical protein